MVLIVSLVWCCGLTTVSAESPNTSTNTLSKKPLLLAFYHPWYGTPWGPTKQWHKWDSFQFPDRYDPEKIIDGRHDIASADYPLIGPHDTSDPEIVRWHFRLAKAAGIDGFLCSWWKLASNDPYFAHQYKLFEKVWLPVAEQEHFKIAVLDEAAHYSRSYDQLLERITDSLPKYTKSPAYLRINNQPVWYIYQVWDDWLTPQIATRYIREAEKSVGNVYWIFDKMKATATAQPPGASLTASPEWLAIAQVDCFGAYSLFGHWRETNPEALAQLYSGFAQNLRASGKQVQLPILPGHNNTPVEKNPYVVPRKNGEVLKAFCHAVDVAQPDITVICSFNEWLESTSIEPAANWSDPYLYLKILAEWRGKKWEMPPLPPKGSLESGFVVIKAN